MTTSRDDDNDCAPWSPSSVLAALADASIGLEVKDRLRYEPAGETLVEALRQATTDRAREILCDVLGDRHEQLAVEVLINQLANPEIRASAADALAKIGDVSAGDALAGRFVAEVSPGTRAMLAAALGAIRYRAAIPNLLDALSDASPSVRGSAAWSLGHIKALEALDSLKVALSRESSAYARQRLEEAIEILSSSGS